RSDATWENGSKHSGSLYFADTEGVTGSNPVAPTAHPLSSAFAQMPARQVDGIGRRKRSAVRRALPCLARVFTLKAARRASDNGSAVSAASLRARHHVRCRGRAEEPWVTHDQALGRSQLVRSLVEGFRLEPTVDEIPDLPPIHGRFGQPQLDGDHPPRPNLHQFQHPPAELRIEGSWHASSSASGRANLI